MIIRNLKYSSLLLVLFLTLRFDSLAQDEQDCFGAIPVCTDFYSQNESYSGTGSIDNELPGGFNDCLTIDANSVWYTFTVESSGDLSFILTPNSTNADYDWMLFDFSSGDCDEISSNSDLVVSCNSYGNFGENGPTGISTAMGGTGNSNGPGNGNGPEFNADLPVNAGETYLLYIQDWSGSTEGYQLDFSTSTAAIFDNQPPEITSVTAECNGDVFIQFSENIDCSNLELADFSVSTDLGEVTPNSLTSACSESSSISNYVVLSFLQIPGFSLPPGENLILEINNSVGLITDLCGNIIETTSFDFTTSESISFNVEVTSSECEQNNGEINIFGVNGGSGSLLTYSLNDNSQTSPLFQNLSSGIYSITVSDEDGCSNSEDVTVDEFSTIILDAGPDDGICNTAYQLSGSVSEDGITEWVSEDDLVFTDPFALNSTVTVSEPGTYTIQLTSNQNGCSSTDEVVISFSDLENTFNNNLNTCSENCSGQIELFSSNGIGPYSYSLNGVNQGSTSLFSELCPGEYSIEVSDAIGCSTSDSFAVSALLEAELSSALVSHATCEGLCNGSVTVIASAATVNSPQADFDSQTNTFSNLCSGIFNYTLTSSDNCISTFSENIQTLSSINANFSLTPNPVQIENPIVELTDLSSGNPINTELITLTETGIMLSQDSILDFSGHSGAPLILQLIAEDSLGCISANNLTLNFINPLVVFIPNAFSPNNDGLNEVFQPVFSGVDPDEFEFMVFDRWGNEIFSTSDYTEPWRGNLRRGEHYVAPGLYSYRIKVKQLYSPRYEDYFGTVQVVR